MANNGHGLEAMELKDYRFDSAISEAHTLVDEEKFKEAITSLATFINNEESLDSYQKEKIINWSLDYKRKKDLSKEDVEQFIEKINKYF